MLPDLQYDLIYDFSAGNAEGDASMKDLLGGKGANLQEMASLNIPVPPGFTITTEVCRACQEMAATSKYPHQLKELQDLLDDLAYEAAGRVKELAKLQGHVPLVSVRSGAPVSMPGMMDTILNVGLTSETLPEWKKRLGERAALDSYRRLIQMYGEVVDGINPALFENALKAIKESAGVAEDSGLTAEQLDQLCGLYLEIYSDTGRRVFPDTLREQLRGAIGAVFRSWNNERARTYRKLNKISDDMGTAVTVQAMVFGNMNDNSGSGVLFSRDPATGENKLMGEFLPNAQGEDVVAGIRTPLPFSQMAQTWPKIAQEVQLIAQRLEKHYGDMQDIEFTVQDGTLFILQCRNGKRSAQAAFRIAVDMVEEGLIDKATAVSRISPKQFEVMSRPHLGSDVGKPDVVGLPACPGVAVGKVVFDSGAAVDATEPVILVRHETTPDDIAGMNAAVGILTATGGATSHAAVVARAMDKPCVTGCDAIQVGQVSMMVTIEDETHEIVDGDWITIDGGTGAVYLGKLDVVENGDDLNMKKIFEWVLEEADGVVKVVKLSAAPACAKQVHVMAAEWFPYYEQPLHSFIAAYQNRPDGQDVVLHLSSPMDYLGQTDKLLLDAFGKGPGNEDQIWVSDLIKSLCDLSQKLPGLSVVCPGADSCNLLAINGFKLVKEVKDLEGLLTAKTSIKVPDNFAQLIGGQKVLDELRGLMKDAGRETMVVADGVYQNELIYQTLGQ